MFVISFNSKEEKSKSQENLDPKVVDLKLDLEKFKSRCEIKITILFLWLIVLSVLLMPKVLKILQLGNVKWLSI